MCGWKWEGGDFFMSRRSEPLHLSIPHARNFVLRLSTINTQTIRVLITGLYYVQ